MTTYIGGISTRHRLYLPSPYPTSICLSALICLRKSTFRAEEFFRKFARMKVVEVALQWPDKSTQEKVLMVAAEGLTITHDIGDKIEGKGIRLLPIYELRRSYLWCTKLQYPRDKHRMQSGNWQMDRGPGVIHL